MESQPKGSVTSWPKLLKDQWIHRLSMESQPKGSPHGQNCWRISGFTDYLWITLSYQKNQWIHGPLGPPREQTAQSFTPTNVVANCLIFMFLSQLNLSHLQATIIRHITLDHDVAFLKVCFEVCPETSKQCGVTAAQCLNISTPDSRTTMHTPPVDGNQPLVLHNGWRSPPSGSRFVDDFQQWWQLKRRRKKHSFPRVKNGIPLNCLADLDLEEKKQMFPHFHFAWKIIQSLHLSLLFEDKLLKLRIWLTRQELSSLQCMAASRLHQLLHLQGWLETSRVLGERAAIIIIMQFPGVTIFVLRIS